MCNAGFTGVTCAAIDEAAEHPIVEIRPAIDNDDDDSNDSSDESDKDDMKKSGKMKSSNSASSSNENTTTTESMANRLAISTMTIFVLLAIVSFIFC